jgi:hypothetical protein
MLPDGSGYYLDDSENHVQYFVDMKEISSVSSFNQMIGTEIK